MSHECPDCGQTCYCGGDIDDCEFDDPLTVDACTHCPESERGISEEDWGRDDPDWPADNYENERTVKR
jgi:hypothetical protein